MGTLHVAPATSYGVAIELSVWLFFDPAPASIKQRVDQKVCAVITRTPTQQTRRHDQQLGMQRSCLLSCQVQHFKDQDSKVRDACAEAMGVIAAEAFPADESGTDGSLNPLGVFFRPLFEAMGEQSRCNRLVLAQ
jgi:hypothetical protein